MKRLSLSVLGRRKAAKAILESRELFQSTFEQSAVGMAHHSPTGKWLRVNSRLVEMLGFSSGEELCSHSFQDFLKADEQQIHLNAFKRMSKGELDRFTGELRYVRTDGTTVWLQLTFSMPRDQAGQPKYMVTICQDISEKKSAERKLLDHRLRLFASAKMSALGEMASGIAHEINNPLSIIRSYAAVLRDGIENGQVNRDQLLSNVEKIDATVLRITKIVRSLVGYGRDSEFDSFLQHRVRKLVDDTLELCKTRFGQSHVELLYESVPELLEVECRMVPISQVMLNLLNNALDAVEGQPVKWIRVSVLDLEGYVEIGVMDSGPGVPPELREKIMQPFFTTKANRQGTGLGLSISKKIAESHQGTLRLDTTVKDTRFVLRLPKKQG